ncbi:uncharacterized protein LOC131654037 isoform X1 [Vicia villosa]|uniref:uncharacterized protein LOC131654037 isoform X1 n=1 Tax=Vicia villosa TaxID=3911 RepID=UPI00273CC494|nr:uncharacterized protein LOC131654037 isoform X1 [Vicia villosa]
MLLRTYSAPIHTSSLHSHEQELNHHHPKTLATLSKTKKKKFAPPTSLVKNPHKKNIVEQEVLFSSYSLDKQVLEHEEGGKKVVKLQTLVMGGGGMGCDDGGRICGGGNGNGWENNYGRDETHAYYQNMIEANPNNYLLLGNYAKFLKEVCGDYGKAEEYVERAILANPGYADALSLYANIIWYTEKNADRAEAYFDQAVKSDPNDCYVLASYAKFLWDAEDDGDEDNECQHKNHTCSPEITAASKI